MFGNNPKRKIVKKEGDNLYIQNIFPTFQGEGPLAGYPAIFIRLGGCNLACNFCDTDFEAFRLYSLKEILKEVKLAEKYFGIVEKNLLIVITGGEPMRQPIEKLCSILLENEYQVQIETNGTIYRQLPAEIKVVCSPKNTGRGYKPFLQELIQSIYCFKFIISANNKLYNYIPEFVRDYNKPVYLQPMDEFDPIKNKKNKDLTIKIARSNGYRISLQMHKEFSIE